MKPVIFTVSLFSDSHFNSRRIFTESWKSAMPDYEIKVYTEKDKVVQEALLKCSDWINVCSKFGLYNFATNAIRLYILGKFPNHLYIDNDVFVYKNIFENIDTSKKYISQTSFPLFTGILSTIYNGDSTLNVENTLNYLNEYSKKLTPDDDSDFILGRMNDNRVASYLQKENSFRTFPENLFFHFSSVHPFTVSKRKVTEKDFCYETLVEAKDYYLGKFEPGTRKIFIEEDVEPYCNFKAIWLPNDVILCGVYKYSDDVKSHIITLANNG